MSDGVPAQRSVGALRLHLDCNFAEVRRGAAKIREYLHNCGLLEKDIWACELAFVEGCNNAVQHTPGAQRSRQLLVEVCRHGKVLELRIIDHTAGCDFPEQSTLPGAECESGRGIFLMRSLMDDVTYLRRDSSNCLVLKKAVTGI